jgi:hypothetical protein
MAQNPLLGTFDHTLLKRRREWTGRPPGMRNHGDGGLGSVAVAPALGRLGTFQRYAHKYPRTHTTADIIEIDISQANVYR